MKALAVLQMIFGALASFIAWSLADLKAHLVIHRPGMIDSPPPNPIFEFALLFFGLAILTCGYFQRKKNARYAGIQIINGLFISFVSGFLAIRAASIGHGEVSGVYYLVYIPMILGLLVFVVGIVQLIRGKNENKDNNITINQTLL